ncbi:MAG: 50S ribosomal protein L30 [Chloroflexi bacterium]|nr:50S ribosomal protein L30 [Chloroflexota bacterium]
MAAELRVTLVKSVVGTTQEARGTVRALGLRRIGQTVDIPDNPATRGMIRAVRYLVSFEEGTRHESPPVGGRDKQETSP